MLEIIEKLREFTAERDWGKFHTPENLAKSICIEAAELLEIFQWGDDWKPIDPEHLREEIADVQIYLLTLADKCNVNMKDAVMEKIEKNRRKYA